MNKANVSDRDGGVLLTVKVVPGSSRTVFAGVYDGMVRVKIAAAPEKGKANKCLVEYLSKLSGAKKKSITILSGMTSPVKQVRIEGIGREEFLLKLGNGKQV